MIKKETVEQYAIERINELNNNLFIVSINVSPNNQIKVEIDSETGGVSIEDCIAVSRNIEHNLDRETEDFELEVSSAGLDKPLRVLKQYIKNIGKEVKILLTEDNKSIEGTLLSANEERIEIEASTKIKEEGKKKKITVTQTLELPYNKIKETKIKISFKK